MRHYNVVLMQNGKNVFRRDVTTKGDPQRAARTALTDYSKHTRRKNIKVVAIVTDLDFKRTKKYNVARTLLKKPRRVTLRGGSSFTVRYMTKITAATAKNSRRRKSKTSSKKKRTARRSRSRSRRRRSRKR